MIIKGRKSSLKILFIIVKFSFDKEPDDFLFLHNINSLFCSLVLPDRLVNYMLWNIVWTPKHHIRIGS